MTDSDTAATESPFSAEELKKWRKVLLKRRDEISDDVSDLLRDVDAMEQGRGSIAGSNHPAESASDEEELGKDLDQVASEQDLLRFIDRALEKIDTGRPVPYGLCEWSGKPIPKNRLQLMPWTPFSIEAMEHLEQEGLTEDDLLVDG